MEQSPEGNLWQIKEMVGGKGESMVGQVLVYVDDLMVLGPPNIREGFMKRLTEQWNCAPGETVTSEKWTRLVDLSCVGVRMEFHWKSVKGRISKNCWNAMVSKNPDLFLCPNGIRKRVRKWCYPWTSEGCSGYNRRTLWAAVRTRPDISFSVSMMGQQVTKRPRWVQQVGDHVLGFLLSTWDHCLLYKPEIGGHGPDDVCRFPVMKGSLKPILTSVLPQKEIVLVKGLSWRMLVPRYNGRLIDKLFVPFQQLNQNLWRP